MWLRTAFAHGPLPRVGQRPPVQQRRCECVRAESERDRAVHRSDRCRRCDPGGRSALGEPPGGGGTRCRTPVRSGQPSDLERRAMVRPHDFARPHHRDLCLIDTLPRASYREIARRTGESGMDPRSRWILRPQASAQSGRSWSRAACLPPVAPSPHPSRRSSDPMPRRAGPSSRRRPTSRSRSECGGRCGRSSGRRSPAGGSARRSIPSRRSPPREAQGGIRHESRRAVLPAPTRRSEVGQDRAPTARALARQRQSLPGHPDRPHQRSEGPTAGSRPSRAHFSRWWPSVPVA